MVKKLGIFLVLALLLSLAGCKGSPAKAKDAFMLANTPLVNMPAPKGTAGLKRISWVKRGEKVFALKKEKAPKGWLFVTLSDNATKGWVQESRVFIGAKQPITFLKKTDWFLRPDAQSYKKRKPLKEGQKAFILQQADGWYKINIGYGGWAEGWVQEGTFERGFKKVELADKQFTVTFPFGKCIIRASSWLKEAAGYTYTPNMAFDGNMATSWQEGKSGPGIGEWIEIEFPKQGSYEVSIVNGFNHNDKKYGDLYRGNGRVKVLTVKYGDGLAMSKNVDLMDDMREFQVVGTYSTKKIRLQIAAVYPGDKWKDTSISEIRVRESSGY